MTTDGCAGTMHAVNHLEHIQVRTVQNSHLKVRAHQKVVESRTSGDRKIHPTPKTQNLNIIIEYLEVIEKPCKIHQKVIYDLNQCKIMCPPVQGEPVVRALREPDAGADLALRHQIHPPLPKAQGHTRLQVTRPQPAPPTNLPHQPPTNHISTFQPTPPTTYHPPINQPTNLSTYPTNNPPTTYQPTYQTSYLLTNQPTNKQSFLFLAL